MSFNAADSFGDRASATATATIAPAPPLTDVPITGKVLSGAQPIAGAHVILLAIGTQGYGHGADLVLNKARLPYDQFYGTSATTAADGTFDFSGDYACTPGQMLYVQVRGGDAGSGFNGRIGLLAPVGKCPAPTASPMSVLVNEVTTVASAYALAAYAYGGVYTRVGEHGGKFSNSGTPLASIGLANAFGNIQNLVDLTTGLVLATTPAGKWNRPSE